MELNMAVWQYGSNEKEPWYIQDGIAPQVGVGGLNIIKKPTIGGRAYIPMDGKHDFIQSHLTTNYMWIFDRKEGFSGFVKPRK